MSKYKNYRTFECRTCLDSDNLSLCVVMSPSWCHPNGCIIKIVDNPKWEEVADPNCNNPGGK